MLLFSRFRILGHSMVPSLLPGDEILVSNLPYLFRKPQVNDIVVLEHPGKNKRFVKRITKIQKDMYLFEGDNTNDSYDSRSFGMKSRKVIKGKMIIKLNTD